MAARFRRPPRSCSYGGALYRSEFVALTVEDVTVALACGFGSLAARPTGRAGSGDLSAARQARRLPAWSAPSGLAGGGEAQGWPVFRRSARWGGPATYPLRYPWATRPEPPPVLARKAGQPWKPSGRRRPPIPARQPGLPPPEHQRHGGASTPDTAENLELMRLLDERSCRRPWRTRLLRPCGGLQTGAAADGQDGSCNVFIERL